VNEQSMHILEVNNQNGYYDREYVTKLQQNLTIVTEANNDAQVTIKMLYIRLAEDKQLRLEVMKAEFQKYV
jgi:hypothetical protein